MRLHPITEVLVGALQLAIGVAVLITVSAFVGVALAYLEGAMQ